MDRVIRNKAEKIILIDVAIEADGNATQKKAEKKINYNSFCAETKRMRNMKCVIIPPKSGANGIVTRGLKKNLETIS